MPLSCSDDGSSDLSGGSHSVARPDSKRARVELDEHIDNKRVQRHAPSSFLMPTTSSQADQAPIAKHPSPSLNMPTFDRRSDHDGDHGATVYKPLEAALRDGELTFQRSYFEAQTDEFKEDEEEVENTAKATWGLEEEDPSIKGASRAVTRRLRSYISHNDSEYGIKGSRNSDPSDTKYHVEIDVESITKPSPSCPLSVGFETIVTTRNPEGDGLYDFALGTYVRRDNNGKWTVDEEMDSTEDEGESEEEQEPRETGCSQTDGPSSVG